MKVAIIGSRNLTVYNIKDYIPEKCSEIVTGGACGIDSCAAEYAKTASIKLTLFIPQYTKYGKYAPIKRNHQIVDYADTVIAFWDGNSKGTKSVIDYCKKTAKQHTVIMIKKD